METGDGSKYTPVPILEDVEWTYEMRREMQEIIPGLYLGPYSAAKKTMMESLKMIGISHIVCIRHQQEASVIRPNFPNEFKYLVLDITQSLTEDIIHHIPIVKEFIDDCFSNNGKVLVHGNSGICRSASLVIAYLMEKYGLSFKDSHMIVQKRRFCISPNDRFKHQLLEFEPIYRAKHGTWRDFGQHREANLKRPLEDTEDDYSTMDTTS